MKMPRLRSILITFLLSCTVSTPSIAQAKTIYRCESYTRVDGTSAYRVSPSIAGSFGSSNPRELYRQCLVPVTKKQCSYKDTSNDNKWYKCGDTGVRPGEFDFRKGIGEIVEDNNGKKYYAFNSVVQFTFK
jgi:hypothetical protein